MKDPQDSTGRPIHVGDRVSWRGQLYTIKAFGNPIGRYGTRAIEFEESLHLQGEIPDEIGVDLVQLPEDGAWTPSRAATYTGHYAQIEGEGDPHCAHTEIVVIANPPQPLIRCDGCGKRWQRRPHCCALDCGKPLERPELPFCSEHMKDEQLVRAWSELL